MRLVFSKVELENPIMVRYFFWRSQKIMTWDDVSVRDQKEVKETSQQDIDLNLMITDGCHIHVRAGNQISAAATPAISLCGSPEEEVLWGIRRSAL